MNKEMLELYIRRCIELAKNGYFENQQYPIASMVVDKNRGIIAECCSSLKKGFDPTNHPEMEVIRKSSEILKSRTLEGCYLFSTLEPCPMCTSAAIWAKMDGIVFGALQEDILAFNNRSEKFSWRQISIKASTIAMHGKPVLNIYEGILREECVKLFGLTGNQ